MKKIYLTPQSLYLVSILKQCDFSSKLIHHINKRISQFYPKMTINEYISELEDDPKQVTVVFTNFLSYYCVKDFLAFEANKFLSVSSNGRVRILNIKEYQNHSDFQLFKDLAFDIMFEVDGCLVPLEIKVTQGGNVFSGATHSTSKVNDYLLISLEIDRDIIIDDNINFVKSAFICITSINKDSWMGEASDSNSRTSFKFSQIDSDGSELDYSDGYICGKLVPKQKWYGVEGVSFNIIYG